MDSLLIDFSDREDIRAKLPEAQKRLEDLEEALRAQAQEVEDWREIVAVLTRRAQLPLAASTQKPLPAKDDETAGPARADAQPLDLVVEVVDRELRKIRSKDVRDILRAEGHDLSGDAVSNALFYAARRAKPPRVKQASGRGFYAPLDYPEESTGDPDEEPRGLAALAARNAAYDRAREDS